MAGLRAAGEGGPGASGGHVEGPRQQWGPRGGGVEQACIGSGPARRKGWGLKGRSFEGFPRDPQGHRDGGRRRLEALPRFHSALPSARWVAVLLARPWGFLEPENLACCLGDGGGRAWRAAEFEPGPGRLERRGGPTCGTVRGGRERGSGLRRPQTCESSSEKYLFPETGASARCRERKVQKVINSWQGRAGFSLGFSARRRSEETGKCENLRSRDYVPG